MANFPGTPGNDTYSGTDQADTISGGAGNDTLSGLAGNDSISGGIGDDSLFGENNDRTSTLTGADTIHGDEGNDYIVGGLGNDRLFGDAGNDTIWGDDTGQGSGGLNGQGGNDYIEGGDGNDRIYSGYGNDTVLGGAGNDYLRGGEGSDTLTGGSGFDTFAVEDIGINANSETSERDTITDFDTTGAGDNDAANNDYIDLTKYYNQTSMETYNRVNGTTFKDPLQWLRTDQADGKLTMGRFTEGVSTYKINMVINGTDGKAVNGKLLGKDNTGVICFTPGTLIETDKGPVAVETLSPGDMVVTRDRGLQAVRWIGSRTIGAAELALDPALRPIRISAGALGNGLPTADLVVSPMHRMLVASALVEAETGETEALIAARNLVDLPGVAVAEDMGEVTYVHFMCDQHEVVIANGAPSETLNVGIHTAGNLLPEAYAEILSLFPELASKTTTPVRKPLPGDWGRAVARRHAEEGLALAV